MASQPENIRLVNVLEKLAIGALFLVVSYHWAAIGKLEDRVYNLQSNSFTTENARILEDRLMNHISGFRADMKNETSTLRNEMNSKLDLLIKMQTETPSRR